MGANGKMIISTAAGGKTKRITSNGVSDTKVSVQKQIESTESFVIQGRWPDS